MLNIAACENNFDSVINVSSLSRQSANMFELEDVWFKKCLTYQTFELQNVVVVRFVELERIKCIMFKF